MPTRRQNQRLPWKAYVTELGKEKYLGSFATKKEAQNAWLRYYAEGYSRAHVKDIRARKTGQIWFHRGRQKWLAYTGEPQRRYLGSFTSKEEAEQACRNSVRVSRIRPHGSGSVFSRDGKIWTACSAKPENKYLGRFLTKEEAELALEQYLRERTLRVTQ